LSSLPDPPTGVEHALAGIFDRIGETYTRKCRIPEHDYLIGRLTGV